MTLSNLPNCPACKSKPEDYYFDGVIITCSRANCGVSTNKKGNLIDASEEWKEVCRLYPKPLPDEEGQRLL